MKIASAICGFFNHRKTLMCGVAGIINLSKPSGTRIVSNMLKAIEHRGPDGDGLIDLKHSVFGHKRLAIIDLTDNACQPFFDSEGRYVISFNGEIYNYVELKAELEGYGFNFRTESDTEVLLYTLIKFGKDGLNKLIGMFAGCFYDTELRSGFIFRDHFGQKPLFYSQNSHREFFFCSEVKGLIAAGLEASPNFKAISDYLLEAQYDHNEETFFSGIYQLKPGELLEIKANQPQRPKIWYDLECMVRDRKNYGDVEELVLLLSEAARIHLRSDVEVATLLSGGLDSSTLLCLLHEQNQRERKRLNSFSVEFETGFTERPWIVSASESANSNTNFLLFTQNEFLSCLQPMMLAQEAPIGGLMNCAMNKIFQETKSSKYKVFFDGTGLDEAFGGYRNHHNLFLANQIQKHPSKANKAIQDYCSQWGVTYSEALKAAGSAAINNNLAIDGTNPIRPEIYHHEFTTKFHSANRKSTLTELSLNNDLCRYMQQSKVPRNNRMKDRMSMAASKELRLPFLDWRLVEYGLTLPSEKLFDSGLTKSIIRKAMNGKINDDVRLAQKRSIQAPQAKWLQSKLMKSYVTDIIASHKFRDLGIFEQKSCLEQYDHFCKGNMPNSFFVWQIININLWFETFAQSSKFQSQQN